MKKKLFYDIMKSPIGDLFIACPSKNTVSMIHFLKDINNPEDLLSKILSLQYDLEKNPSTCEKTIKELQKYFKGELKRFSVEVDQPGTPFQKKVWGKLQEIPYGTTKSYQDIAREMGQEKSSRAVGNANNKNKIPIIIPCHRVIHKNGTLAGYAGGQSIKKYLIQLEKNNSKISKTY